MKLSIAYKRLLESLESMTDINDETQTLRSLLDTIGISIDLDIRMNKATNDTELTKEASQKFNNMLENLGSYNISKSKADLGSAIQSIEQYLDIFMPYPKLESLQPSLDTAQLSTPLKERPAGADRENAQPNVTDQEKLVKVKEYLTRCAAAEVYQIEPAKRIGYAKHLDWLVANEKLANGKPPDKKAQAIIDAYIAMPGFGAQQDKHKFVDLHMEIELLGLEIAGLRANNKTGNELKEKLSTLESSREELEKLLTLEAESVNVRLNEVLRDNQELEPYLKPIVKNYVSWLLKINKRGAMPQFTILDGPPGTGKTYFGEKISEVLGIDFQKMGMSSESDTTLIPGRNKGWDDPMPGKCAEFQIKSKSQLFLWFSDELEKAEKPVVNTHVDLFESGQITYSDKFFNDNNIPKNFTAIIATTNDYDILPSHIKSRSEKIIVKGKQPIEKLNIIKKRLIKNINDNALLKKKRINFYPSDDKVLSWFLETYSTQPGYREDNQNVDKIVTNLIEYFSTNNGETEFTITNDFIRNALPQPSAHHAEKQHLRSLIYKTRNELDIQRSALEKASAADIIRDKNAANQALGSQIANKHLMRSYLKALISVLGKELKENRDNIALLQPEINAAESELETFKQFTPMQLSFISENLATIERYGLTRESLTELIDERLLKLKKLIDNARLEVLQQLHSSNPEHLQDAENRLKEYIDEQNILQTLRDKIHSRKKSEAKEEAEPKGNVNPKEVKKEKDTPEPTLLNFSIFDEPERLKSHTSSKLSSPSSLTFSSSSPDRQAPHVDSANQFKRTSRSLRTSENAVDESIESGDLAKPTVRAGIGGELFFKHGVSSQIAQQSHVTLTVESPKPITPEVFDKIINELGSQIRGIQNSISKPSDPVSVDPVSFRDLTVSYNQPTGTTSSTPASTAKILRAGEEILDITYKGKVVEIVSSKPTPQDDEMYAMVLAAKIAAEKCGRNRFTIEHCEDNPQAAFKLYLIGKSMGLTPIFRDGPGKQGQTESSIVEDPYGKTMLETDKGIKSISDIYTDIQKGNVEPKSLQNFIALLEHLDDGLKIKPKT